MWTQIFLKSREKNLRFKKYTCGQSLNCGAMFANRNAPNHINQNHCFKLHFANVTAFAWHSRFVLERIALSRMSENVSICMECIRGIQCNIHNNICRIYCRVHDFMIALY